MEKEKDKEKEEKEKAIEEESEASELVLFQVPECYVYLVKHFWYLLTI